MTKLFSKSSRKFVSILNIFLVLFQNIAPLFFIAPQAFANTTDTADTAAEVSAVTLAFDADSNELSLDGQATAAVDYLLTYSLDEADSVENAITGRAEVDGDGFSENLYVGTCSTDDECTPNEFDQGKIVFQNADYEASFEFINDVLWLTHDGVSTVADVAAGQAYVAPQNDEVSVEFTSLPDESGSLSIEEVTLSDEQVAALGAVSHVAYDITSDMENGSFEYDLKLPVPEESENVQVKYAETVEELDQAEEAVSEKIGKEVTAKELNHFTVFVVVNPNVDGNGNACTVASISGTCYDTLQEAIDNAVSGDTVELASDIAVLQEVIVNKELVINGNGFTITSPFTKTSNSNNSAIGIHSDDVTIRDLMVNGTGGTDLHGINIYVVNNILLDNVTVKNYRSGVIVNGSTVTVNNITTSGNTWHGINVDLGSGVTSPAELTVNGYSSHSDGVHIYSDHYSSDPVSIIDTMSQYAFSDGVSNSDDRLYTLQDIIPPAAPIINSPAEDQYFNSTPILNDWTDVNDDSGIDHYRIEYQYDDGHTFSGAPYRTTTTSQRNHTPGISEQGGVEIRVQAFDNAGNEGAWSEWRHYFYDTTGPEVTLTAPTGITNADTAEVKGSVTDDNMRYYACYITTNQTIDAFAKTWTTGQEPKSGANNDQSLADSDCITNWTTTDTGSISSSVTLGNFDISGLPDGSYTIHVHAHDQAGNVSEDTTAFTIDNTAPVVSDVKLNSEAVAVSDIRDNNCDAIQNFYTVSGDIDFSATIEDDPSGVANAYYYIRKVNSNGCTRTDIYKSGKVSMAKGDDGRWSGSFDTTSISDDSGDGEYTIQLITKDGSGNQTMKYVDILVDNTAPVTTLSSPNDSEQTNQAISIIGESTDANIVAQVNLYYRETGDTNWIFITNLDNSSSAEPFAFSYDWTPATNGTFDIKVSGTDVAGNVENSAYAYGIIYDSVSPTIILDTPAQDAFISGNIDLQATCDEDCDYINFWWRADSESYSNVSLDRRYHYEHTNGTTFNWTLDSLNAERWGGDPSYVMVDGDYYFYAAGKDLVGNWARTSGERKITVDNTAPSSTITTFNLENGGEKETSTFDGLIEGTATDDSGSGVDYVNLSVAHLPFGADEADTQYWDDATSSWVDSEVLFKANGADSWNYQLTDVPEGVYTVTSHAIDKAGNEESTYTIKIVYDKTIPEVTLSIDPTSPDGDNSWYQTLATVTLTATDNYLLDKIEYRWNSDSWTTYSDPINPPAEGQNILYYRGIDQVGNTTEVGVKEVKYDATSPNPGPENVEITDFSLPTGNLKWDLASDAISGIRDYDITWKLKNDGGIPLSFGKNVSATTTSTQIDGLTEGEWEIRVKALDEAGNWTETLLLFTIHGSSGESAGTSTTTSAPLGPTGGSVLGTTTPNTTTFAQATADTGSILGDEVATKSDEEKSAPKNEAADEKQGNILGASTSCAPWLNYLPLILLALQTLLIIGFGLMTKRSSFISMAAITFISLAAFYLLRNETCFADNSFLSLVNRWFVVITTLVGLTIKGVVGVFTD